MAPVCLRIEKALESGWNPEPFVLLDLYGESGGWIGAMMVPDALAVYLR
jgi:hypothetical protein